MLTEEQKHNIEALSDDEMAYEIELGNKSRYQGRKFAYLKAIYKKRNNKARVAAPRSTVQIERKEQYDWHNRPLGKIAIGVIIIVLAAFTLYAFRNYLGVHL